MNEVCDPNRFEKKVDGNLKQVRMLLEDGLFTAYNDEPVRTISISQLNTLC